MLSNVRETTFSCACVPIPFVLLFLFLSFVWFCSSVFCLFVVVIIITCVCSGDQLWWCIPSDSLPLYCVNLQLLIFIVIIYLSIYLSVCLSMRSPLARSTRLGPRIATPSRHPSPRLRYRSSVRRTKGEVRIVTRVGRLTSHDVICPLDAMRRWMRCSTLRRTFSGTCCCCCWSPSSWTMTLHCY